MSQLRNCGFILARASLDQLDTYQDPSGFLIDCVRILFKETSKEFAVRLAWKPEEIQALLEVGFEFVCEKDGLLYFRKRK